MEKEKIEEYTNDENITETLNEENTSNTIKTIEKPKNDQEKDTLTDEEIKNMLGEYKFEIPVPDYLKNFYSWAYLNPKSIKLLDNQLVQQFFSFFYANKLTGIYLDEVNTGDSMLQLGNIYGNTLLKIAKKIGTTGQIDLIDVVNMQLAYAYKKLNGLTNIDMWQQDATTFYHREYNIVGSFFLLHELPLKQKVIVINNMLKQVKEHNAKAVFIDYNQPSIFNPLRPFVRLANSFVEPFINDLWEYQIEFLAQDSNNFIWEKTTYLGKMYQKVVVKNK